MAPKSGSKFPGSAIELSDTLIAGMIGTALRSQLGGSRQAAKTVMRWTHVSDHTARSWINGQTSPSSLHLLEMATQSEPIMAVILKLTGHPSLALTLDLAAVEYALEKTLKRIRLLRGEIPE
ncbi:hypothetical protein [Qipengyuania atrilutea]|uniref:XRE family transcriptional regulator n=1 Tax=Qipengyuania atrilutea TaxID=2744473 RepID=A0A850H351_9SPHN|nr:hypothetical protein [Actirhodobacter atriluteus]NVD45096.1 hypothetical protein [Actirhodobacter atriluteus]